VAVRAPLAEGSGFAWFANRGVGRPVTESLKETLRWFRDWMKDVAPATRPVIIVGFSGGAAFAGGLLLDDPERYAGGASLYGTLPFGAGVPTSPHRLGGLGAATTAARSAGGHGIVRADVTALSTWISALLYGSQTSDQQAPFIKKMHEWLPNKYWTSHAVEADT
jgi:phospholipase/carboxylesterase